MTLAYEGIDISSLAGDNTIKALSKYSKAAIYLLSTLLINPLSQISMTK